MKVTLIDYSPKDEKYLSFIPNLSKSYYPKIISGLFEKTIEWHHDSIQEWATYDFCIELSRVSLAQLTRYRIGISYLAQSSRHTLPLCMILPEGINRIDSSISFSNGYRLHVWSKKAIGIQCNFYGELLDSDGFFVCNLFADDNVRINEEFLKIIDIPIEDIRYGFPEGVMIRMFVKVNGRSLRHILGQRIPEFAQWEIRKIANLMYKAVYEIHPFMLNGVKPDFSVLGDDDTYEIKLFDSHKEGCLDS